MKNNTTRENSTHIKNIEIEIKKSTIHKSKIRILTLQIEIKQWSSRTVSNSKILTFDYVSNLNSLIKIEFQKRIRNFKSDRTYRDSQSYYQKSISPLTIDSENWTFKFLEIEKEIQFEEVIGTLD